MNPHEQAEHLAARYPDTTVDVDAWAEAIAAWSTPLPTNRPWRQQAARLRPTSVRVLAPAVARTFTPPAGTRPQPRCPLACFATHAGDVEAA